MACTCLIDRRGGGNQGRREVSNARAAAQSTERLGNKILRPRAAGERARGDGRTNPNQRADADGASPLVSRREVEGGGEKEGGRLRGVISIGAVTFLNGDFTQPTEDEVQEEHNLLRPIGVRVEAWDMIDTHARAQKRERVGFGSPTIG